jgi:UDP-2,4-diacetamido-2,4,6-trideoxy-beta-L-altropyranose hydrolase
MSVQTIVIRADATGTIGTGHVMRCIALAQELLIRNCSIHFVMAAMTPSIARRLEQEGFCIHTIPAEPGSEEDAEMSCEIAGNLSASWIILDGYNFGGEFQKAVKRRGFMLFCIDDYAHADRYSADVILNQNLYAEDVKYLHNPGTRLLLGPQYALLRKEILPWREKRPMALQETLRIVVTMGGSDPENVTLEVIHALQKLPSGSFSAKIIIGGSNPHSESIARSLRLSGHSIEMVHDIRNIGELFAASDLAINAGGSTTLELAYIGVPMITIVIADNQKPVCEALAMRKAAINLGVFTAATAKKIFSAIRKVMKSPELRTELSGNGVMLVDGKGAARVADLLCEPAVRLRKAQPKDCWTVFSWINEPYVREISFSSNPILWDEHMSWYLEKIADPDTLYCIILMEDSIPAGQVRFDIQGADAMISILVDPDFRGRNIGVSTLRRSAGMLFARTGVQRIHAYIKTSNTISYKAFRKAGFVCRETVLRGFENAYHMILGQE